MRWQAFLAGALASVVVSVMGSSMASAAIRITSDPGGEVAAYLTKYHQIRDSGQHIVIDGPCLSACTLFTGILPRTQVCVTRRAMLGFHAASYYDDASRQMVPTREGTRLVMNLYPDDIRNWIKRHGGLTPRLIRLSGRELDAMYHLCP